MQYDPACHHRRNILKYVIGVCTLNTSLSILSVNVVFFCHVVAFRQHIPPSIFLFSGYCIIRATASSHWVQKVARHQSWNQHYQQHTKIHRCHHHRYQMVGHQSRMYCLRQLLLYQNRQYNFYSVEKSFTVRFIILLKKIMIWCCVTIHHTSSYLLTI